MDENTRMIGFFDAYKAVVIPRGIVYAGAHVGERIPTFLHTGCKSILAIEPNAEAFAVLERQASAVVECVHGALSDRDGASDFHAIAGMPTLNSIFAPDRAYWAGRVGADVLANYPVTRRTVPSHTLDALLAGRAEHFNVLYMNIQGAELAALAGAARSIGGIDAVITEVNFAPRYVGCALFADLDARLDELGFRLMLLEKQIWSGGEHGDAWYVRKSLLPRPAAGV